MRRHIFIAFLRHLFSPLHGALLAGGVFLTYLCVISGFDWWYFLYTYEHAPKVLLFLADGLGFLIPILLPIVVLIGERKGRFPKGTFAPLTLSILGAFFLSMCIKAFTGRISPPHHGPFDVDISHMFQFGFMEHHIIGGWPSSHAAVMFALCTALFMLLPLSLRARGLIFFVAVFVAVGVTFGFHWFSELVMGAVLGIVVGRSVVYTYRKILESARLS
jgi:membrane-associated phospholipid phosphatase